MSEIRRWLEDLGLEQYAEAFEANEITLDFARDLTDADLEKLGVAVMGHRKALSRAIGGLTAEIARTDVGTSAPDETPAPSIQSALAAERRQLTVMFCDLVGSTSLTEQLDPEDLRSLMADYQKACGTIVERYDGHVAQYLGDGVMSYFGWPRAHEDDAQRAVRAGLEIVAAVQGIEAPVLLSVRVGISTGPVVVGETGAGDASMPKAAVGETPNLAARMQALAAPNTLAIADATRRLIGGAFELEDLGPQEVKGIDGPVGLYRVLGEGAAESRFEAAHVAGLTPLVGRQHEIGLLVERWQQARDGEGQVILLSGEAGIGKSRITQVLRERLADESHTRLRYQCSPYHTNSAFHPIIEQIARVARFERDDGTDAKLDKLEALLSQSAEDVAKVAPLFAAMLSLPVDRYPPLNLGPQRQKQDTIATLTDQTVALSLQAPVLVIFEDVHWIDPTTLEALSAVVDRIQDAAVLMVITYRPDFEPPWTGQGHVTLHSLNRLGRRQGADMVAKLTDGNALPDEVLDEIIAKTDGVPLFVEELTKNVLEAGFLKKKGGAYVLDGPLPPLAIPATLQDSLMARLDRFPPIKETAQIGACIGREFSHELLSDVSPLDDEALGEALSQLASTEVIFRRGIPPNATYTFKHALVQDAAYESLLKSRRAVIHGDLAKAIEASRPDIVQDRPEVVARHYSAAANPLASVPYWTAAAHLALKHSAHREAIAHLNSGLENLQGAPPDDHTRRLELDIHVALGPALIAARGHTAPETVAAYNRAYDLAMELGDRDHLFPIYYGLWVSRNSSSEHRSARSYAKQLFTIAKQGGDRRQLLVANRQLGTSQLYLGELAAARKQLETAWSLYDRDQDTELAYDYAQDPGVAAATLLSCTYALIGLPDQASAASDEAIARSRSLGHATTLGWVYYFGALMHSLRRDIPRFIDCMQKLDSIALEHQLPLFLAMGDSISQWPELERGSVQDVEKMRRGNEGCTEVGHVLYQPLYKMLMARGHGLLGDESTARKDFGKAFEFMEQSDERWLEAELLRSRGDMERQLGVDYQLVERDYHAAITVARAQGAKLLELRATTSLASLWREQGKRSEARECLLSIYDWFTEGFDTADLKDAKALLKELN